jgi:SAM-dependent methyltransferase
MKHEYEKMQNLNLITKSLHSTRYSNLEELIKLSAQKNKKLKIVDVGCGKAKSYEIIKSLDVNFHYLGIEIREDLSEIAKELYGIFENFEIVCDNIENVFYTFDAADVIIGLECFDHISDYLVLRTVEATGKCNFKRLYLTLPNEEAPAIFIKNVETFLIGYRRYKDFSWAGTLIAPIYNFDKVERHRTGQNGFDWRWLAHTLLQNCKIKKIIMSPLQIILQFLPPSIVFICENDKNHNV